jgi:NAD(P)H-hydrate epimerase
MRSGAGLVTLASSSNAIEVMATKSSENTYFELKLPNREEESVLPNFEQKLGSYNALLIGPGLGEFSWKPAYIFGLDVAKKLKSVIDADSLNYLARTPEWWKQMPANNILTPHPAELARLRGTDVATIEANRVKAAREAAAEFQQVVILKGAYTLIAAPDGRVGLNPAANPALATAGSGDVLAGICAGLLTQASKLPEIDTFKIACCGVYLHALAGELCRREMGDTGVLAGDLLTKIPLALRNLKQGDSLE